MKECGLIELLFIILVAELACSVVLTSSIIMEDFQLRKKPRTKRLRPSNYCPEFPFDLSNPKDSRTDCYRRSRIRKGHSQRPWRYSCSCVGRNIGSPSARRRLIMHQLRDTLSTECMY